VDSSSDVSSTLFNVKITAASNTEPYASKVTIIAVVVSVIGVALLVIFAKLGYPALHGTWKVRKDTPFSETFSSVIDLV